jgi:hypothetical protein
MKTQLSEAVDKLRRQREQTVLFDLQNCPLLSYAQIAKLNGVREWRVQRIAKDNNITRLRGTANPAHPLHKEPV